MSNYRLPVNTVPIRGRSPIGGQFFLEVQEIPLNTKLLEYVSDGDTNGVAYWLGTNYGTQAWTNPHTAGRLTVTIVNSNPAGGGGNVLVDRINSADNAGNGFAEPVGGVGIISIDLGSGNTLNCNCYSIRSRGSFPDSYPRDWKWQGSNDFVAWADLDTQTNNTNLFTAGQWLSIPIPTTIGYRYFRIAVTNSTTVVGRCFLSEFELYGTFSTISPDSVPPSPTGGTNLTYVSDGDTNGIFYWLGTNYGAEVWSNPYTVNRLAITYDSILSGQDPAASLVDRQPSAFHTAPGTDHFIEFDLLSTNKLTLSYWSYLSRGNSNFHIPNRLILKGSNDQQTYIDIADKTITPALNTWYSFAVTGQTIGYRYLKVFGIGAEYFTAGEFEFYGTLVST